MGKPWNGTLEEQEIIREISKHQVGTKPIDIFNNFDSQTWEVLKNANRISGNTKEWSVYRILCKMLKNPTIIAKANQLKDCEVTITPQPSDKPQIKLDQIIEEVIDYVNSEIQKAVEEISQNALDIFKKKINDLPLT